MSADGVLQDEVVGQYLDQRPFVRRRWLTDLVERHLDDDGCGHVLVTAAAGMGKSSLMAALTTRHGLSPRYFIRLDSSMPFGSGDAAHLLIAIGRQLAELCPEAMDDRPLRIEVTQSADSVRPGGRSIGVRAGRIVANPFRRTGITVRQRAGDLGGEQVAVDAEEIVEDVWRLPPATLQRLALLDPAAALAARDPDARIVVLVDGLDELRHLPPSPGWSIADWLAHCPRLPANVRVVVASRPDPTLLAPYRLRQRDRLREVTIDGDRVDGDLRAYADAFSGDRALARALARHGVALRECARVAATRAKGNFLFLVSWSRALAHAADTGRWADVTRIADQDRLPDSLGDLYDLFALLLRQAAGERWERTHRPLLAALVVANAPLTTAQWALLAGQPLDATERAARDMLQFLTRAAGRTRLFHLSLAEHLTAEDTRARTPDTWIDPAMSNQRGAAELVAAYGDDWAACQDDYAIANVVAHLVDGAAADPAWTEATLRSVLADNGYLTRKIEVVGATRAVADYAIAAPLLDDAALLLAEHAIRRADSGLDADTLHSALGYRTAFDGFYGAVLASLADLDFVTERAPGGDADLEPASIWADFAEIAAGRLRRNDEPEAARDLLDRVAAVRGDQSRALYERAYLDYLHGRVDSAIDYLDESAEAALQAGRTVSYWITVLVRDLIKFYGGDMDAQTYGAIQDEALAVFTAAAAEGNPHAERWIMNTHDHRLLRAAMTGDPDLADAAYDHLRDNEWAVREQPDVLIEWRARHALATADYTTARHSYERILGPDALTADPPTTEGTARRFYEYALSLDGDGDPRAAEQARAQVLRCSDGAASWPWKNRLRD